MGSSQQKEGMLMEFGSSEHLKWMRDNSPRPDLTVRAGDLFAFYGILMDGVKVGEYNGTCQIPGRIYSVHDSFPALIIDGYPIKHDATSPWCPNTVNGQLWRVPSDDALRAVAVTELDRTEGFDPLLDPDDCMYLRRRVGLVDPALVVWVYEWNGPTRHLRPVPSGDWAMERENLRSVEVAEESWNVPSATLLKRCNNVFRGDRCPFSPRLAQLPGPPSESSRRETPPKFPTRQWVLRSVLLASKAGHASTARDYEAWYTGLVSRLPADERPSELRNWPSPTLIEVMFGSFEAAREYDGLEESEWGDW